MSQPELDEREDPMAEIVAKIHARECKKLIIMNDIERALVYCTRVDIIPPACSLTGTSPNAEKLRNQAIHLVTDFQWWRRQLKQRESDRAEEKRAQLAADFLSNKLKPL
ncbi:hypothetical protein [Shewanella surugensis]|uniref:Uncharacterized protein n=1 Tax=Shewanella surugensis TaxID=212020 RepID=A0ABT0LIX8_9GAMM|nr:hypothetical protein [Shewanella surugensis]MCL1127666.1 hypothetical protein [Shewanella surugensis]